MFHCLYYSVTFNKSKEKFRTVLGCILTMKKIVAPSSCSNFPTKLIC